MTLLVCSYALTDVTLGQETPGDESAPGAVDPSNALDAATAEIRKAVEAYVAAFNSGDAKALSEMWTSEGVYTVRSSGERFVGRDAISKQFEPVLGDQQTSPKLAVESSSIEFVSPRVALERGTAIVTRGENDVSESQYTVVYVKDNDKWLIDRITEDELLITPSHYQQLRGLEWMIGQWIDAGEGVTVEMDCNWTANQNFISRRYSVKADGFDSSGLQIIGWDAKENTIRSWLFDSDGGFISGTWTEREGSWIVQSVTTLADGSSGSFTSIFKPQDDGTYTWRKINRVVDGKLLPNIDEIIVQPK
jgi:uncharacterized protein (TIGR02246 family)